MCMSSSVESLKTAAAASAYCAFLAVDGTLASADSPEDAALARAFCSTSAAAGQVRFRSRGPAATHPGASPPAAGQDSRGRPGQASRPVVGVNKGLRPGITST